MIVFVLGYSVHYEQIVIVLVAFVAVEIVAVVVVLTFAFEMEKVLQFEAEMIEDSIQYSINHSYNIINTCFNVRSCNDIIYSDFMRQLLI
jgi:polynucleotide 5'-kinase involved in rRNA processing